MECKTTIEAQTVKDIHRNKEKNTSTRCKHLLFYDTNDF